MDLRNLDRTPSVKAVMTPFPWTIQIQDALAHACHVMEEKQIRHLPVTEDGRLVGIVTERDAHLVAAASDRGDGLTVADACTREIYVVTADEPLDRVLLEMADRRIGSALVVKQEKLVGIVTAIDACRSFGELLRSRFGGDDGGRVA